MEVEEAQIPTSQEEEHVIDISGVSQNKAQQGTGRRGQGRPKGVASHIVTRQAENNGAHQNKNKKLP